MNTWVAKGCMMTLMLSSRAAADAGQGAIGQQSRATVRISVSVAPRFTLAEPETFALVSNAPGARFSVERIDDSSAPAATGAGQARHKPQPGGDGGSRTSLLLVVPD